MRQRKGVPAPVVPSATATYAAYPGSSDSAHTAHQASSTNTRDLNHRAATTAATATDADSFQRRANRLEEMERSLYYTPQLLWLQVMDRMPYELTHYFVSSPPPHHEAMLSGIREQYGRPYSAEKPFDVELLGRLWNGHSRVMFATDNLVFSAAAHSVSDRWKEMGFQGTDPSTDFRGAGIFGLAQLVYLVEHHPEQWSAILTPDFMAAAAGLNVTMRLATLLGINSSLNQFSSSVLSTYSAREARLRLCRFIFDPSVDVATQRLSEVYCFAMRLLHYRWMRSTRNIMELNQQLSNMYTELDRLLFLCNTLEELCSLL
ncbi:ELMO/CED-12 family [Leishmania donovani]|nr:ELMO/CED-12 family protein [Leishmania donovani]CAJ1988283.1 ELMO/CED-12 family [Leishmania donovani]